MSRFLIKFVVILILYITTTQCTDVLESSKHKKMYRVSYKKANSDKTFNLACHAPDMDEDKFVKLYWHTEFEGENSFSSGSSTSSSAVTKLKFYSGRGEVTEHVQSNGLVWVDAGANNKSDIAGMKGTFDYSLLLCRCVQCSRDKNYGIGKYDVDKGVCTVKRYEDEKAEPLEDNYQVLTVPTNNTKLALRWREENGNDWLTPQNKVIAGKGRRGVTQYIARKTVSVSTAPIYTYGTAHVPEGYSKLMYYFAGDSEGETRTHFSGHKLELLVVGSGGGGNDDKDPDDVPVHWINGNKRNVSLIGDMVGDGTDVGGDFLKVCRYLDQDSGNIIPGKLSISKGTCNVIFKGPRAFVRNYQVLTNPEKVDLRWVPRRGNFIPDDALVGGLYKPKKLKLYIGRAKYKNTQQIGIIDQDNMELHFVFEGKDKHAKKFEILTVKRK